MHHQKKAAENVMSNEPSAEFESSKPGQAMLGQSTLALAADLADIQSSEAIHTRFQLFTETMGFDSVACFKVPDPGEHLDGCVHMCTRPQGWVDRYIEQDYVRHDPLVQQVFRSTAPYTWSEVLERTKGDPTTRRIQSERAEFGLHNGFIVPIYDSKGYSGLVSLAGEATIHPEIRNTLTVASIFVHNRLVTLVRDRILPDDLLSIRESECLNWAAEGKSDWEIGQILHISAKTVNYHIENVKKKFGVPTRVQAIVSAFRYGKLR
jgi:LuxR family transcriptional regulator, quorum-sensing system regulator BjaR1